MNTPDPADHRDPSSEETAAQAQEPVEADPETQAEVDTDPEVDTELETEAPAETETDTEARAETEPAASPSAAVFVRRRGGPSLTFWVLLCLAVPAVATLVIAPLLGVSGLTEVFTVTLAAVFGIGVPLAGVCAVIDAIVHRRRR